MRVCVWLCVYVAVLLRAEEVKYEGEVREEMAQLESLLATAKREYELLRIEFEKRMAANEQAAPLAKCVVGVAVVSTVCVCLSLSLSLSLSLPGNYR